MTRLRTGAVFLAITGVLLLLIEGLSGALFVAHTAWELAQPLDERVHTQYDAELGWVSVPAFSRSGMYGEGADFSIDPMGFRANPLPAPGGAPGRLRVVCSGDSFTFGVGVGDAETWCHRLTTLDSRIETVNMGQIGYGVDQAFLWYRRDAAKVPHDVQVLAFVMADFDRMRYPSFMSYGKPVLALEGDALAVRHTPVPPRSAAAVKLQRIGWALTQSRTAQVLRFVWPASPGSSPRPAPEQVADLRPVVARLLEALWELHEQQHTTLVLAFLPTRADYDRDAAGPGGGRFATSPAAGLPWSISWRISVRFPGDEVDSLFIAPDASPYALATGHYSPRGHDLVAKGVYRALSEVRFDKLRTR